MNNVENLQIIAESHSERDQMQMVYTVNAVVSEQAFGWTRRLNGATGAWEWVDGETIHPVPQDVVHNPALSFQAIEALVEQNPGLLMRLTLGAHHGGYEVMLVQGERIAAHVAGRPIGLMIGLLIVSALGLSPQDERQKLFPLITG